MDKLDIIDLKIDNLEAVLYNTRTAIQNGLICPSSALEEDLKRIERSINSHIVEYYMVSKQKGNK